jgi:hypothetical protein
VYVHAQLFVHAHACFISLVVGEADDGAGGGGDNNQ